MLKLRNLRKSENTIEADFYPEDSKQAGHVVVDLKTEEITDYTAPEGYEKYRWYATHARQTLMELAEQDSLPEEYLVMWY